ncbi:hypothetical protein PR003_g1848 [Phytophthora rubi]|uniref:HECT-type E3 ubiquitin transferase n=1 Tax=Phytophthora rubi TaxID=129364 RepID=A0A6A4FZW7_9STRA|nr:hypothetical protein PR003_g1848 [Phytophthora rubi]
MESAAPSRSGGRKRRGGGNSENEERKTQDPPAQQQEAEEEKGEKEKEDKNKKEKEEKEEEDKEKKPPTHWSCAACTFLNEASRVFCEMCETPNPSPPAASARALTGASEWSCAACTMVNPAAMRVCGVCGTLNPRPPAGLSIVRLSQALGDESLSSASSDGSDEDDSDDSDDEEEEDDEVEDTWICRNCDALAAGRTCSNCFAQRLKIARKSAKAAEEEKKCKEERKQALMKKRKRRKREKKLQERARMAYGVSIYELKKLVLEPTSSRLVDTLQTLTHTLAMMDASADNEWGDGPSFLMRGFGAGPSSDTAKDPELLTVLADIFRGKERTYPVEVRQLAVQAISYLMRMDRHMFARSKMVEVVGLYITDLLAWKKDGTSDVSSGNAKSAQMIVEECLSGLSSMCSTEAFALRELLADGHFVGYLDFLTRLVDGDEEKDGGFHPSILMTALGILQKGCMKLRWGGKPGQRRGSHGNVNVEKPSVSRAASPKKVTQESQLTLELAVKLVSFLRHVLEHKHIPLHVKASKCLLLLFHRAPHNRPEVMEKLVTPDVLRKFVAVVVNANNESEESRLAMVSLLLHLFENRAQLVNMFVREKIYAELFSGMLPLLQSSSTALRAHALKLTAMLARVVCRKHSLGFSNSSCHKSMDESSVNGSAVCSPQNRHNRHRLNSLPDPDVLSKLLLDFIRADSIPAVNVLLKDGADLNFPKMLDLQGNEIDKPLNVAVQCASLGMVRLLLKRGADIHQVGIGGTALHVAAKTGRCDVATFLLQCGARVQARDRENKTVMNVINSLKDDALSGDGAGRVPSPMAKLLELHQRAPGMRDYESDLSESDGMSGGRSQAWFYPSDHDDEYGDEDEMDDDDLEGEENYYMNYNDDEDEGVDEDMGDESMSSEDMGDESMSSDGDMVYYDDEMSSEVAPSRQHRHGSTASGSETKFENAGQDTGESNMTLTRRGRTSSGEKDLQGDNTELEQKGFTLTPEEAYDFCFAITQCLLAVLHDMDIQNVERSVISTVACVLEMAPSRLIRVLKEVDVVLILDSVHFLLQGEKHRLSSSDPTSMEVTAATPTSLTSATDTTRTGTAPTAPNSNLPSFILAVRILQAMIRKSAKESSIFHQIERRGISEQIEQLNDASACWISTSFGEGSSNSRDTIFGRGLDLLKSLRADMLESGMLHLHKLRNLARRLKEFTDSSSSYEKYLILVDLVDLFEQPNSITTYEFKQSELLPAILQYLSPQGQTTHSAPRIAQDSGSNSPPNDLIGSEAQAEEETPAPALSASTKAAGQHKSPTNGSSCETPALQTYLKPVGAKPKLTCTQLPKVNLVVGFRKCDASTAAQDRIIVSSEFGLQRLGRSKINNDMPQAPLLIQLNRSTQRFEATPGARKALLNVFNTFSGNTGSGSSQKKKRRKLSPVAQRKTDLEGTPWDIDKFIAFMMILRGPAKYGHPGSNAKYCVVFSKFADPDTNRSLLKADGFISLMVHECKDDAKSKQLLKFLRSRGYSEKSLTYSVSRSSSRDDDEEKDSPSGSDSGGAKAASTSGNNTLRQPVVLRGFPGDQNVLKCVEDLRQEYRARAGGNNGLSSDTISSVDATLPPWKLTYKLYCDFQVEWETQPPSNPNTTIADAESLESLAALESKTPTRLLSHGIVTLDCLHANGATDASRWLSRITDSQAGLRGGIAVPKSVASAVRLLRYLFEFRADSTSLDESLWASPRLYNKLETQMQDVLSMCSGIYPPWCDTLVTHCKFFFPRELREKLFRSTSFGCTRSLHWFRSQLNIEESSADSTSSMVGGGLYNQEISISPIPKERVKVHRENILQSAEAVMKMHAKRKAILDVVFVGEKGYGSGVTAAFYSTTAHALQSVVENQTNRYWIPGEDDEADAVKAAARRVNGADDFDSIADDAAVIRHSNGLFPFPHRTPRQKLVERFRMMGRLAGKALMDERLLPLPLSPQFMKLVVGETFGLEELSDIFLSHGRILHSMYKASKRLAEGERDVQIDQMNVEDWLDAVGLTFIDPLSQEPLVAGGEDITVTASNLTLYVRAVLELWLESGIHAQVLAFRDGIGEVLPIGKLRLLFVPELLSLLCGEKDIEWGVASLLKDTKLAHGYTKDSEPVQYFFEVLDEMASAERRAFLLYATGCPNLPPGGFQALKPPFEVVRRVVDNVEVDRALPFARTCTNTLHLPAYSSKAVLAKQLAFAVANSRGVIDRD